MEETNYGNASFDITEMEDSNDIDVRILPISNQLIIPNNKGSTNNLTNFPASQRNTNEIGGSVAGMRSSTYINNRAMVSDNMKYLSRVESINGADENAINRQKKKIWYFSIIDFLVFAVTFPSLIVMYSEWKDCYYNFNWWAMIIVACSLASFSLNLLQVYNLRLHRQFIE